MRPHKIEPSPRQYPAFVTLLRRGDRREAAAPTKTTFDDIESWLFGDAAREDELLPLIESMIWRLVAAGLPLDRASFHVGTLHPQLLGFAWNWNSADGLCDEVRVAEGSLQTDAYLRNPLHRVIDHGEVVVIDTAEEGARERFRVVGDLIDAGIRHYVAMPLGAAGTYHNAITLATKDAGGFSRDQRAGLDRVLPIFALHVQRHIALRIAANVLDIYLGEAAGGKVLEGTIARGSGEAIRAVIWASDLRGFTDLADRLSGPEMTALLNEYFGALAGAVVAHGGEVLKFIGDGMLAVFPFSTEVEAVDASRNALAAAEQALAGLAAINETPPEALAGIEGWQPLRSGIALHEGEVFFGNVGAPERLDFTVIGRAVNATARVEALSKQLGRSVLVTAPVAGRIDRPFDDLGRHELRGLAEPMGIFGPAENGA
ncbi:MAG: adenylate/guanylate cyclase domain-containing protein [Pseudomonadota bacterium]